MSRIVGLIILLMLTVLLVPPIRTRARPYMQPALDPVYEWSARNRVKNLLNLLQEQEILGKGLPAPRDFSHFVEQRDFQKDASLDPWGQPYYLRMTRRSYSVGSSGRDQVMNTADDIVSLSVVKRGQGNARDRRNSR